MRRSRLRAGYSTQAELAAELRVPRPYLSMLEAGKAGWMSRETVIKLIAGYSRLRPVDLSPVREAIAAIAAGSSAKDAVEEAFLTDHRCYRTARGELTITEVAEAVKLSVNSVRRFEDCKLDELDVAKVIVLAAFYAGLADQQTSSHHIPGEEGSPCLSATS